MPVTKPMFIYAHPHVTLSDSVWAEAFPGTVSTINEEASLPEYRSQYRSPDPDTSSSSSNSIQGRQRSSGPSDSEIAEEDEDNDSDEGSSTPIQAPAKESALSSPDEHVGSAGLIDTQDSDDIMPEELFEGFVNKLYR